MEPYYDTSRADQGDRVCSRIHDSLHAHITWNDPLEPATNNIVKTFDADATFHAHLLDADVRHILADISKQFNMILHRGAETAEEEEARSQIKIFLKAAMPDIERIERDLAKIRQKYAGL
jgi:hypothetical protein